MKKKILLILLVVLLITATGCSYKKIENNICKNVLGDDYRFGGYFSVGEIIECRADNSWSYDREYIIVKNLNYTRITR